MSGLPIWQRVIHLLVMPVLAGIGLGTVIGWLPAPLDVIAVGVIAVTAFTFAVWMLYDTCKLTARIRAELEEEFDR